MRAKWHLRKAEIKVSRPGSHTLRHTCVQPLVDSGFSLKTIGDFIGHRTPDATKVYAKVNIEALREVALGVSSQLSGHSSSTRARRVAFYKVAEQLPGNPRAQARGEIYKMIFALLYGLGLRVGEVSRLCRKDIDLVKQLLLIRHTKFGKVNPREKRRLARISHEDVIVGERATEDGAGTRIAVPSIDESTLILGAL